MVNRPLEEVPVFKPGDHSAKHNPALFQQVSLDLEDYSRTSVKGKRSDRGGGQPTSGDLEFTFLYPGGPELAPGRASTLELTRRNTEALKLLDKSLKTKDARDAGDIPLSKDAKDAKADFIKVLERRFADDPETLRRLKEDVLPKMEQDILHRDVKTTGGRPPIDMQKELAQSYRDLARLGGGEAERLTYTDSEGRERYRYSKGDVDRIIVDACVRESDRAHMFNQGKRKECAGESISRVAALLPSEYFGKLADLCTKGEVEVSDLRGGTFKCRPDAASLRVDGEGQKMYWSAENHRGAAGIFDVFVSQYNLDLASLDQGGSPGRYLYTQELSPVGQSNTGEHVWDTRTGREIARNPLLTSKRISQTIQGLIGDRIDDHFGERMTLVGGSAFGNPRNVTSIRDGQHLARHLRENQDMGWDYAVLCTHTGNYHNTSKGLAGSGGKRGGWHATGVQLNDDGTAAFINNWGNLCRSDKVDTNTLASWMHAPKEASWIDRQSRDHIIGPDRKFGHRDPFERDEVAKRDHDKPETKDQDKALDRLRTAEVQRRVEEATAQLAQFRDRLAALTEGDPRRNDILSLLVNAEHRLVNTIQEMPNRV